MATFQDYLDSLGAKQASIGYGNIRGIFDNEAGEHYYQPPGVNRSPAYAKGFTGYDVSRGLVPRNPNISYGEQAQGGFAARPGYVDASGGFLGYGSSPDQLANPTLLRGYSDFIAQDPAREAQQIANRQAEQDLFDQQLAARQQTALTLPQIRSTPQQQAPVSPMGGWGQPANYTQPAQQTGMLGGLHRGSSGGMGMLSGGLNRGGN